MAYTQAPTVSVYQTKDIPLMQAWQSRDYLNAADVRNQNVVWDVIKNQTTGEAYLEAIKRDGISEAQMENQGVGNVYAVYYWDSQDLLVTVGSFGFTFHNNFGVRTAFGATVFFDAHIGFTQFLYDNGTVTLIVTDGTGLYEITTAGVVTAIVDPDVPAGYLPYPVFLDGYLFLGTRSGNIHNSSLNDPKVWAAADLISVESYPDGLQAIARHGQYIAAFGTTSIQFFYDAANPTGTPLAAQTTVLKVGFRGGLTAHKESLIFIGSGANNKSTIYELTGLKANPIVDSTLIRHLEVAPYSATANLYLREGNIINVNGHTLYTWADRDITGLTPVRYTYAVDLDSGLFTQTDTLVPTAPSPQNLNLPIRSAVTMEMFGEIITLFCMIRGSNTDRTKTYNFSRSNTTDNSQPITVLFQTKLEDFGTKRMKFISRLLVDCDRTNTSALMRVSLIYDDQLFTGSSPDQIDLSSDYPVVYGLGNCRTLQVLVNYQGTPAMRWRGVEVDYIQGDY